MPLHGNAAVSHGNDWVQTDKQPIPWIWDGLVAEDAITLLSAPEKTGKTTLLSLLLDRRRERGQLLGRTVRPGRSRSRARGPLVAFVDILLDMQIPPGDRFTRRRHFHGVGRYPGTLQHVAAELNPEGTDYLLLADGPSEPALAPTLETLRQLLS